MDIQKILNLLGLIGFVLIGQATVFGQTTPTVKCPQAANLSIETPPVSVEEGKTITFTARLSGSESAEKNLRYKWSVDHGKIISGQNTGQIVVTTDGLGNQTITAKVVAETGTCPQIESSEKGLVTPRPRPRMIDQYRRINCEDSLARFDQFLIELQNYPTATAYIVLQGAPRKISVIEREFQNQIKNRFSDPSRITFVKGEPAGRFIHVTYWLVPPGADSSETGGVTVEEKPEIIPPDRKPFIWGSLVPDSVGGCEFTDRGYDLKIFAETLKANPGSRGNIVIYEPTKSEFRAEEKYILRTLKENGIERKRLRVFYVRQASGKELWFLPGNK